MNSTKKQTIFFTNNILIDDVEKILAQKGIVFKNTKRSFLKLVEYKDKKYLVKNPREKNSRLWFRVLTFFKKSYAIGALESMERLSELNIKTNSPVACVEYRKWGVVVESSMIYSYVKGREILDDNISEALKSLRKIHSNSLLHGDPQAGNFLIDDSGEIVVIDAQLKNIKFIKIEEYLELIKFALCKRKAFDYIEKKSIFYTIAWSIIRFKVITKSLKDYIKAKRKNE